MAGKFIGMCNKHFSLKLYFLCKDILWSKMIYHLLFLVSFYYTNIWFLFSEMLEQEGNINGVSIWLYWSFYDKCVKHMAPMFTFVKVSKQKILSDSTLEITYTDYGAWFQSNLIRIISDFNNYICFLAKSPSVLCIKDPVGTDGWIYVDSTYIYLYLRRIYVDSTTCAGWGQFVV